MKVRRAKTGWSKRAPSTRTARRALKAKCGTACFLQPRGDGGAGAFPVCRKLTATRGKCVVDCQGLKAAFSRARQYGHARVAQKAVKAACRVGCAWPGAEDRCKV